MPEHQVRPALLTIQAKIGAISVVALLAVALPEEAMAQSGGAQSTQSATPLPTVSVDITRQRRKNYGSTINMDLKKKCRFPFTSGKKRTCRYWSK